MKHFERLASPCTHSVYQVYQQMPNFAAKYTSHQNLC